jgi:hypothetical protein
MKTLCTLAACLLLSILASAQKQKAAPIQKLAPSSAGTAHRGTVSTPHYNPPPYNPASQPLYQTIVRMDSLYFDTYNHSKAALMDSLTADNVEFYHDRGGLMTSKQELLQSIQKNIFGKVQRILTPGSIEVYEIPGYGAIEFGYHSFRNLVEHSESHPAKFVIIWRLAGGKWQMTRVVSLH